MIVPSREPDYIEEGRSKRVWFEERTFTDLGGTYQFTYDPVYKTLTIVSESEGELMFPFNSRDPITIAYEEWLVDSILLGDEA